MHPSNATERIWHNPGFPTVPWFRGRSRLWRRYSRDRKPAAPVLDGHTCRAPFFLRSGRIHFGFLEPVAEELEHRRLFEFIAELACIARCLALGRVSESEVDSVRIAVATAWTPSLQPVTSPALLLSVANLLPQRYTDYKVQADHEDGESRQDKERFLQSRRVSAGNCADEP